MHTIFDWIAMALFCALALLFLQRSVGPELAGDRAWHYLPPALLLACADQLGNRGHPTAAVALLVLAAGYVVAVLRPGRAQR